MQKYRLLPHRHTTIKKFIHPDLTFLAFIMLFLIAVPVKVFGQKTTSDDKDISINATSYFFAYDMKFKGGSTALGPTLTLNTNGKISVQFGFLFDLKKHVYYEKRGPFNYDPIEYINVFVPFSLQYNYFNSDKITLYLTGGFVLSGLNKRAGNSTIFDLTLGTGIAYHPLNWLAVRTYPTIRYNLENFSPGVSVDIGYLFSSKTLLDL